NYQKEDSHENAHYATSRRNVFRPLVNQRNVFLETNGNNPKAMTQTDKEIFVDLARSVVDNERRIFNEKCALVRADIWNEFLKLHTVTQVKGIVLRNVEKKAGGNKKIIYEKIENLSVTAEMAVSEFIEETKKIVADIEKRCDSESTDSDFIETLQVPSDLKAFLQRYLN
ncbi:MAG: hypothetical protein M3R00_08110, partial [Pseudomonadota bacterium]|nr:hypothetical protein [Pseudomonadota bacterium]